MLKRASLFFSLMVIIYSWSFGQTTDGKEDKYKTLRYTVPFITIAPDSRSGAMGDAGVATSADVNSQHWNVAKYPFLKEKAGVSLSYTPWLRGLGVTDLNLVYLTGYKKFSDQQAVSGSIRYFNLGEINEVDDQGGQTGNKIRPNEFYIDAGYSRVLGDYFSLGMAFRFIYSDIANGASNLSSDNAAAQYAPGKSFAADISAFYQKPVTISNYNAEMAYGINISNIGYKMSYSQDKESQFIPTNLRLGGRLSLDIDDYNKVGFTLDLNKLLIPTPPVGIDSLSYIQKTGVIEGIYKSFYDAPGGAKEEFEEIMWSIGTEYLYMQQFAIRAGYFNEYKTKGNRKYFTVGAGFYLNVFSLDFSYLFPAVGGRSNPLANTMRFTLGFKFK
jgi:hypothetical protein